MVQVFKSVAATNQTGSAEQGRMRKLTKKRSLESSFCEQNTTKTWAGKSVLYSVSFQNLLGKDVPPPVNAPVFGLRKNHSILCPLAHPHKKSVLLRCTCQIICNNCAVSYLLFINPQELMDNRVDQSTMSK